MTAKKVKKSINKKHDIALLPQKKLQPAKRPSLPKASPKVEFVLAPHYEQEIRAMRETFSPYGMIVFLRTYARKKEDGNLETWHDVVIRVINGTFYFKKEQSKRWCEKKEQKLAFDMAVSMFRFQWLPPGRGLWAMSKDYIRKYGNMALNNCGFVSTEMSKFGNISLAVALKWMMDASMLGVGVGFDCDWDGEVFIPKEHNGAPLLIKDSREGWYESTYQLLLSYLEPNHKRCKFDYSAIRAEGELIKQFGGVAAGPSVLVLAHRRIEACFECFYRCKNGMGAKDSIRILLKESLAYEDDTFKYGYESMMQKFEESPIELKSYLRARLIVDLFNIVGVCVVSGNVRRSAEVALGHPCDKEFLNLKNFGINPEREYSYGWMSNNSVRIETADQYNEIIDGIVPLVIRNGEPGIINLVKINAVDPKNPKKKNDRGVNPCVEITLESFELCCLAEAFGMNCFDENGVFSMEIFLAACKYAALYASIVSCIPCHSKLTAEIVNRNHRVGVSQSGLWALYETLDRETYISALKNAFQVAKKTADKYIHDFCGTYPIAVTTVKPSGSISTLAQSLPGVHPAPENRYVIRRIRVGKNLPLAAALIKAGIQYETSKSDGSALVFLFPIDQGAFRSANEVAMWEQCMMAMEVQQIYSDNGVSLSLYFERNTEAHQLPALIKHILPYVKGISFMPRETVRTLDLGNGHKVLFNAEMGESQIEEMAKRLKDSNPVEKEEWERFLKSKGIIYEQAPFSSITKEEYDDLIAKMPVFDPAILNTGTVVTPSDGSSTKYCDALSCSV